MIHDLWVIEFNTDAENMLDNHSWHIEKLESVLLSNNANLANKKLSDDDWLLVGVTYTYESAVELRDKIKRNYFK